MALVDDEDLDPAYMLGQLHALETLLKKLIVLMPDPVLEKIHDFVVEEAQTLDKKAKQSGNTRTTVYSTGFYNVLDPFSNDLINILDERREGAQHAVVAADPVALKQWQEDQGG